MAKTKKQIALQRIKDGEPRGPIARDLGVTTRTLANWAKAAGLTNGEGRSKAGTWAKGVSGNPAGASKALTDARRLAHRNALPALQRLQAHADRLQKLLDEGSDPTMGQTMTAAQLTQVLKILASPALAPEKSTVEVQHTGEVAHAHRVTIEPVALGSALDLLHDLGAIPAPPAPAAVGTSPPAPPTAGGPLGPAR